MVDDHCGLQSCSHSMIPLLMARDAYGAALDPGFAGRSQGQVSSTNGSGGASSYDLSNIIAAVSTISGQWKELGSGLGLQPVILDAIQGPPEVCMVEVIKHWIHGAMAASRQRLFSALARMGRTDLAEAVMAGVECGRLVYYYDVGDFHANKTCPEIADISA
ncbi:hypothetical protein EMCRGX_G018436 [Ephydatia muelleri]